MQAHTRYDLDARHEEWERSEQAAACAAAESLDDPFEGAIPLTIDDPFEMPEPTAT